MPVRKFWAYVEMLPVLRAQEALAFMNHASVAFGGVEDENKVRSMQMELEDAATRGKGAVQGSGAYRPTSPAEMAALAGESTSVEMAVGE